MSDQDPQFSTGEMEMGLMFVHYGIFRVRNQWTALSPGDKNAIYSNYAFQIIFSKASLPCNEDIDTGGGDPKKL